jgi:hypothetical protein
VNSETYDWAQDEFSKAGDGLRGLCRVWRPEKVHRNGV